MFFSRTFGVHFFYSYWTLSGQGELLAEKNFSVYSSYDAKCSLDRRLVKARADEDVTSSSEVLRDWDRWLRDAREKDVREKN